jgi:integrase
MPLTLKRRAGSPNWYIRGTIRGVTVDESTGLSDKGQAEALRAKREWEIVQGHITGRRPSTTFLSACVSYMDGGGEARYVIPLMDYFAERPVGEINQVALEEAARALYPGRKPSTVNRQVFTPASAVIRHAAVRGMCDLKAFERPKQPKGRVRWLTLEESDALIEACAPHLRPLVTFLFYTGARLGEALLLDWRQVSLGRGHVAFLDTKNGSDRGVPLHARAIAALANLPHREGRVFLTGDRRPYRDSEHGGGQIRTGFEGACKRAGIVDFHPHDCRHTWATWHYAANRDLLKLMTLGGWKTMSMVQRYAHVNTDHLASSIHAMHQQNSGSPSAGIEKAIIGSAT